MDLSVGFRGDSFAEFDHKYLDHSDPTGTEDIVLFLQTNHKEGLLLWQGQNDGDEKDYLLLEVEDGYPVFAYDLGGGEARIKSNVKINDGITHKVKISRSGRRGSIQVDNKDVIKGLPEGLLQLMNANGNVFIGGMVGNLTNQTKGLASKGFRGCIQTLSIQNEELDFKNDPKKTGNLVPCKGYDSLNEEDTDYLEDFYESLLDEQMSDFDEDRYLERLDRFG